MPVHRILITPTPLAIPRAELTKYWESNASFRVKAHVCTLAWCCVHRFLCDKRAWSLLRALGGVGAMGRQGRSLLCLSTGQGGDGVLRVLMQRKQKLREPTFTSYLNAADDAPFLRPISVLPLWPFPVTHAEWASEQLTVLGSSHRWTRVRSARSRDAPPGPRCTKEGADGGQRCSHCTCLLGDKAMPLRDRRQRPSCFTWGAPVLRHCLRPASGTQFPHL